MTPNPMPTPEAPLTAPFKHPRITDDQLLRTMADRIKPLVMHQGELHYIEEPDLRKTAYTWDPKVTEKAEGLEYVKTVVTLHTYGYCGFFKPSIEEVLASLPEEGVEGVVAWFLHGPDNADDLNREREAVNAGYHVAYADLYRPTGGENATFG